MPLTGEAVLPIASQCFQPDWLVGLQVSILSHFSLSNLTVLCVSFYFILFIIEFCIYVLLLFLFDNKNSKVLSGGREVVYW